MTKKPELSPIMQQYLDMKSENPNAVLLFRLGDFFESFFGDAVKVSKALDLVLTHRGMDERGVDIPMCGIPWHAADSYFGKLVKQGINVAIAEQMETPDQAKSRGHKQIERKVVRVLTAGTLNDESLLDPKKSNYLAAVYGHEIVATDISTGELLVGNSDNLYDDMIKVSPAEVLFDEADAEKPEIVSIRNRFNSTPVSSRQYDNFVADNNAMKMLLWYLKHTQKDSNIRLQQPKKLWAGQQLLIDANSWKSLEIDEAINQGGICLLDIIDETKTASGGRLLRQWLHNLSGDADLIAERQGHIEHFVKNTAVLNKFLEILGGIPDVGRSLARLESGRGMPRDLQAVLLFLKSIPKIKQIGLDLDQKMSQYISEIETFDNLTNELNDSLVENMPTFFRDGGVIKKGFSKELDDIRDLASGAKEAIAALQSEYSVATGINNLKIKFNGIIGYFIEIPEKVAVPLTRPESGFIHRQTTGGNVRLTTEKLADLDSQIKNAAAKADIVEQEIISEIISLIKFESDKIGKIAGFLAEIDVYASLAVVAEKYSWVKPNIVKEPVFLIKNGRHPVVEKTLRDAAEFFIRNDCELGDGQGAFVALLTGPNMSGKSTYLRQNALIAVLAHLGSFVPADVANIGIIDQLFSRVGASDNLASGQSTFMVEMSETANILNLATNRSFIIFDEVGRGTATFDGMAIAHAVLEYLDVLCPRCLFATHYHELTDITLKNAKNLTVRVDETDGEIVFMHKVVPGNASRSYGIHVAKMAGMPEGVLKSATRILDKLEKEQKNSSKSNGQLRMF